MTHNGLLFLDELPEFNRKTLEVLRQPLEDGVVTISRALSSTTFPSDFMLVTALNPCPCGYRGDPRRKCNCSPPQVEKYMGKVSGPLLDRIDIHVEVPAADFGELNSKKLGTSSETIREEVTIARKAQLEWFNGMPIMHNAQISSKQIRELCKLDKPSDGTLSTSRVCQPEPVTKCSVWPRTIADLDATTDTTLDHSNEAIYYRMLNRNKWQ